MGLKDHMPFFSDPPPWYYRAVAIVCGVLAVFWLFPIGLCLWEHDYWPLLVFGVIFGCMVMGALKFWQRARMRQKERVTQERTPDV